MLEVDYLVDWLDLALPWHWQQARPEPAPAALTGNTSAWDTLGLDDPRDLPSYSLQGVWWVLWLVVVEYAALWWQGAPLPCLHDNVLSLVHGTLYEISRVVVRSLEYGAYLWVWQHWALLPPLQDTFFNLAALVVLTDFLYYWLHRANHEIAVLWSVHQVHHSSQDLTVSVGLRHSPLQRLFSWVFYLPLALLGVPPAHMLAHAQFNLLYQCWTHTEVVSSLGPLDLVFNTPIHHQVHHGSNSYTLDKNYGGVFILWDRLFGTFQARVPGERVVYGIVYQPDTFNPLTNQVFYFGLMLEKAASFSSWTDKLNTMLRGPGWLPGSPWRGWRHDQQKGENNMVQTLGNFREARASATTHLYVIMHFLSALALTSNLAAASTGRPVVVLVYSGAVVAALTLAGVLYEQPPCTRLLEGTRCAAGLALCLLLPPPVSALFTTALTTLYALSLTLWLLFPSVVLCPSPAVTREVKEAQE